MGDIELPEPPEEDQHQTRKGVLGRVQQGVGAVEHAQAQRSERKDNEAQSREEWLATQRQALLAQGHELYEYRVVPVRSKLIGDKVDVSDVERMLNEWAVQGWHVRSITETSVSGRLGPGGTMGLIVVFERRIVGP